MDTPKSPDGADTAPSDHRHTYLSFLWKAAGVSTDGKLPFYAWMTFLTAILLVGVHAWAEQTVKGMDVTGMTDQVSWGLYIANFTFAVGLAAGAVAMVIPAYLYKDKALHDVVIVGEVLAVAAITVALAFVICDLGRPDRFWHMMPVIGRFNWPISMLTWDVIALSGYLLLNLHITGYLMYMRFLGREPSKKWYVPFVMISIVWAVSIHTVTAFLYSGLGGRPFWNTAILAPRFIASAFVTGPAFIVLALLAVRRLTSLWVGDDALKTIMNILRVSVLANLFMVMSEVFTEFYTGGSHVAAAKYLYFGLHGKSGLVPWIWTAITLTYPELRETQGSALRNFIDHTLSPSGKEPVEITPDILDEAAIAKVMAERASRRAYDGAPPTIPHAVHQQDASACLACHGRALELGNLRANFPSHHPMASCNQCHVPNESPVPGGLLPNALPVAHFEGLPPKRGERAWGGAPPVIPHPTFLRERCMSCHGPTGNDPIRTTHPWRQSCTQCHAPDAERDQHP